MPRYNYRCEETGEVKEFQFSMTEMKSVFEEDGKTWKRDISSEGKAQAVIIPAHMKAGSQVGIMRGNRQRPSGKRKLF